MFGIYVVVGHHAYVSCRFWKPPRAGEVMPKVCLGPERTMETNLIYASTGYPKYVDNPKEIWSQICKDLHTSDRISFERETPNWAT